MKLGLISHCTIDTIILNDSSHEQVGGSSSYGALTARNLKLDVEINTKFGHDFQYEEIFKKNNIKFDDALSDKPTTRFTIKITDSDRVLFLKSKCMSIDYRPISADGILISPVFDEISYTVFEKIKGDSNFIFLDPQGFLREIDEKQQIFLKKTNIDLSKITAIKVNPDEISNLVGDVGIDGMKSLQKKGIKYVLLTNKREISMLEKNRVYSINLPDIELNDTTGIGDIFSSSFSSTMLREKDFFWAFCFAGAAAQAALETRRIGLDKVPKKGAIETNAAYFYNTLKFKEV